MQDIRVEDAKDPEDCIRPRATKIISSIYLVTIAARARYLQQTGRGRASSSGDTDRHFGHGRIYHMSSAWALAPQSEYLNFAKIWRLEIIKQARDQDILEER